MKKNSKKFAIIGTLALIAAMFISCPTNTNSGTTPTPEPLPPPPPPGEKPEWLKDIVTYPDEFENDIGIISGNLVEDGDADGTSAAASPKLLLGGETGVTSDQVDGGATGKCYKQMQTGSGTWQETNFDLTPIYGQGKSYLVSFKYKADPDAANTVFTGTTKYKSADEPLHVSYAAYSGDVKMVCAKHGVEHYDFAYEEENGVWGTKVISPWGGPFSTDEFFQEGLAEQFNNPDFTLMAPATASDTWKECNVVIACEDIAAIINNTGMYYFGLSIYMGEEAQGGFSFLLDDIAIYDLNSELEQMGVTWKDPAIPEEEEVEEGEEGEGGEGEESAE